MRVSREVGCKRRRVTAAAAHRRRRSRKKMFIYTVTIEHHILSYKLALSVNIGYNRVF